MALKPLKQRVMEFTKCNHEVRGIGNWDLLHVLYSRRDRRMRREGENQGLNIIGTRMQREERVEIVLVFGCDQDCNS